MTILATDKHTTDDGYVIYLSLTMAPTPTTGEAILGIATASLDAVEFGRFTIPSEDSWSYVTFDGVSKNPAHLDDDIEAIAERVIDMCSSYHQTLWNTKPRE